SSVSRGDSRAGMIFTPAASGSTGAKCGAPDYIGTSPDSGRAAPARVPISHILTGDRLLFFITNRTASSGDRLFVDASALVQRSLSGPRAEHSHASIPSRPGVVSSHAPRKRRPLATRRPVRDGFEIWSSGLPRGPAW